LHAVHHRVDPVGERVSVEVVDHLVGALPVARERVLDGLEEERLEIRAHGVDIRLHHRMRSMFRARRQFLKGSGLGLLGLTAARRARGLASAADEQQTPPAGMPPAFGTGPAVGPEVSSATIAEAEKLMQIEYTAAQRAQAAGNWRVAMAPLYERRSGPRRV